MENWQYLALFGVGVLSIGCFAAVAYVIYRTWRTLQAQFLAFGSVLGNLNERMAALEVARAGAQQFARRGVEAREQYSARRQEAIFAALAALKTGAKPQDILLAIAQKYPDVAVQVAQNPEVIMQDIKRMGIDLPPEVLAMLGNSPAPKPPTPQEKPPEAASNG